MKSQRKLKIGVIYGGRTAEHEVSVASAHALLSSMDRARYDVVPIGIDLSGHWHIGTEPRKLLESEKSPAALPGAVRSPAPATSSVVRSGSFLAERFACTKEAAGLDVVFPLIHGTYGEDGTLQGFLEMAGIPYVGSGVLGSAICMDKWTQKLAAQAAGIRVVPYVAVRQVEYEKTRERIHERILTELKLPVFVKPSNSGSSRGIVKVKCPEDLGPAITAAFQYDRRVVVEKGMNCREIEVSVLGNDEPRVSRVGEIIPLREWYDYEAKYTEGGMRLEVPARIPPEIEAEVQALAVQAFTTLHLSGMSRIDFFQDRDTGQVYLNEINTIPGFTAMSVYSKLWAASGLEYRELVDELIRLALERQEVESPRFLPHG